MENVSGGPKAFIQVFRMCHVCNSLNEAEDEILRCTKCGKSFLPLNYFERIRGTMQSPQEGAPAPANAPFRLHSLNGLIVLW